jgi:GT2 family glycosyltransferase
MVASSTLELAVVIPVFNRWHFTKACLDSLRVQSAQSFYVIVVDDGSTDQTLDHLSKEYPEVKVLQTRGDLFWTDTVNLGIRYALEQGALRVMTLNNDVLCPPVFVEKMLAASILHPTSLIGALALEDERLQKVAYAGEEWQWLTDSSKPIAATFNKALAGLHPVTHFPGRGLLIPRVCLDRIGVFDAARFPHYMADYDYTMVARRAGFEVLVNYDAPLITYPEASGDRALRAKKTIGNYIKHLTNIRGGGNLINFWRYSFKNCPPLLLPINLVVGTAKRLVSYWVK